MNLRFITIFLFFSSFIPITAQEFPVWDLLFTDVQLFTGEQVMEHVDLAVLDGKIAKIGPQLARQSKALETIDGAGKTIIPGLINSHVHAWFPAHLQFAAQAGVLAVCDMHGSAFAVQFMGQFKDSLGYAHYYAAGPGATVPEGHGTQFGIPVPVIDSTTSARQFALNRIAEGVDYIKILREPMRPTLTFEQIDTIIQTAHEAGVKVVAHVSRCDDGVELVRRGIDGLVHIWFDRSLTDDELAVFEQHENLFIVPTILTNMKVLDFIKERGGENRETLDSLNLLREVLRLHEVGVQVLVGTDPPNFNINYGTDLYEELKFLEAAGISPEQCLAAATSRTAHYFGMAESHLLKEGEVADFLLINGDPIKSVDALYQLEQVWQSGKKVARDSK